MIRRLLRERQERPCPGGDVRCESSGVGVGVEELFGRVGKLSSDSIRLLPASGADDITPPHVMASERTDTKVLIIRRILDTLLWMSALIFCVLSFAGTLRPPKTSFVCTDPKIRMPFTGDTVSASYLLTGCIFAPVLLFCVTETVHFRPLNDGKSRRRFFQCWGSNCGDYLLGVLYVLTVTEVGKVLIGELRPHFIDSCRPDWSKINCSAGLVTEYTCTTDLPDFMKADMYKAFPSGHASVSVYCFIFCSLYVQARIPRSKFSHLFRSWIQLLLLVWACVCSLTRITDNRHHWWDVLAGGTLGAVAGIFMSLCVVQNRFLPPKEEDDCEMSPSAGPTSNKHMTSL